MQNLYPMIDTENIHHMSSEMKHALSLFEAANCLSITRKYSAQEVRDFIAKETGDRELARQFEPRFLFSV